MVAWNYQRIEPIKMEPLKPGKYRVRIHMVEPCKSAKGYDMYKLSFDVSGTNRKLFYYLVFMPDNPEITNRNLTALFDAFPGIDWQSIPNPNSWIGKVGAAEVINERYKDEMTDKIRYFVPFDKQATLPPWQEPPAMKEAVNAGKMRQMPQAPWESPKQQQPSASAPWDSTFDPNEVPFL